MDCTKEAKLGVGVGLWPPKCVQNHVGSREPIARLTLGLALCPACFQRLEVLDVKNLVQEEMLKAAARQAERETGYIIERGLCRFVPVQFTDQAFRDVMRQVERFQTAQVFDPDRFGEVVMLVVGPEEVQ